MQKQVTFDNFAKGEYGDLDKRQAGATPGFFRGTNMLVNRAGIAHPRPGMRDLAATSVPSVEAVVAFGWHGYGGGVIDTDGLWFVADDGGTIGAYGLDASSVGNAVDTYLMTDPIDLTGRSLYGANILNGGYSFDWLTFRGTTNSGILVDHDGQEVTIPGSPASMPDGAVMAVYGDRLFVSGSEVDVNRVYYSDAGILSWGSFPSLNFFDVLDGLDVSAILDHRGGALIGKRIGRWGYYTGSPGLTDRLEQVTRAGAPANPGTFVGLGADEVAFIARNRNYVQIFNGSVFLDLRHLTFMGDSVASDDNDKTSPRVKFVQMRDPDDFLVYRSGVGAGANAGKALVRQNGTFTYHQLPITLSGHAVRKLELGHLLFLGGQDDDAAYPQAPVFYVWDPDLGRPAHATDDDYASVGDGDNAVPVDASFATPEHWTEDGSEVLLRTVIVDFVKWDLGVVDLDNGFDIKVVAHSLYQRDGGVTSGTQSFTEATAAGGSIIDEFPLDDRRTFNFGDQGVGSGFHVELENIVGVGIRSITCIYNVQGARTGG